MPLIRVETTEAIAGAAKQALCGKLSRLCAAATGKPEAYVMVSVIDRCAMTLAGQDGPAAFVDVRGIGGLNGTANNAISQGACALLTQACGIPGARVYLNFTSVDAGNWGHDGSTFG